MERLVAIMERDDKLNYRANSRARRETNRIYVSLHATHIDRETGDRVALVTDRWGAQYIINSSGYKFRWYRSLSSKDFDYYYQPIDEVQA
jgi:hypothetical protein